MAMETVSAGAGVGVGVGGVRFGIMGCAEIARKLCRAISLSPNASLVAIGSRSLEKAARFRDINGLPADLALHASYDALLADPSVDAVYVPLPTSLHHRWAVAAARAGKHVLLEKPVALNVREFDEIMEACEGSGVQFMDGTMWVHHPRTATMKEMLSDASRFGRLRTVNSIFSFAANSMFLDNDIRVKPDLDALGCLGDIGWYCIRSILWAADYELPKTVVALKHPVLNNAGVILSCSASLLWEDGKTATFHCSFLAHMTMQLCAIGTKGTLQLNDFVIPFEESSASFTLATDTRFTELVTGWSPLPSKHVVNTDLPQESLMVTEFSRLVLNIRDGGRPDLTWPSISRKTQLVIDAVKASIEKGLQPVELVQTA